MIAHHPIAGGPGKIKKLKNYFYLSLEAGTLFSCS
jgi:hypothetical protein